MIICILREGLSWIQLFAKKRCRESESLRDISFVGQIQRDRPGDSSIPTSSLLQYSGRTYGDRNPRNPQGTQEGLYVLSGSVCFPNMSSIHHER